MHGAELGNRQFHDADFLVRNCDSGIGRIANSLGRWNRIHHLPKQGSPVRRVLPQQFVDYGRPGTRQAGHKHRLTNLLVANLRMALEQVVDPQAALEHTLQFGTRAQAPEQVESGLVL